MRVVVTPSARFDLAWWRRYYRMAFPQGAERASRHMDRTVQLVARNPHIGRPVEGFDLRQLNIPSTPFALIYVVRPDRIEIVRVWDMRQEPTQGFQED